VTQPKVRTAPAADDTARFLLDVHLYEYQTLTTRATYYIVMGTSTWPLIISFIGFLATVWHNLPEQESSRYGFFLFWWIGALGAQLALIFWTFLVCEQYKTILYIETRLRPLVQDLVHTADFWLYEQKLRGRTRLKKWLELQTELWMFVAILAIALYRVLWFHRFDLFDWVGLAMNLVVLVPLSLLARSAAKIRHGWEC